MLDEVLTIKAVAALLKLKQTGQWRIKRAELDQWIDARPRGGDGGRNGDA